MKYQVIQLDNVTGERKTYAEHDDYEAALRHSQQLNSIGNMRAQTPNRLAYSVSREAGVRIYG